MKKQCIRVLLEGTVQGVGFRPFVYRAAHQIGLKGWVCNVPEGLLIEAEGSHHQLSVLLKEIQIRKPINAEVEKISWSLSPAVGYHSFEITQSQNAGVKTVAVLPDLATCCDCQHEIFDPTNRRYQYPFTNCTHCGPRFSIIHSLPYDRVETTMASFRMCEKCREEFENPLNRRFHAQPNACDQCGPHLTLWDPAGKEHAQKEEALLLAAKAIASGNVVAVKGLGGFHLMCDARREDAVVKLRKRKNREEKPFALMFPTMKMISQYCILSGIEKGSLSSQKSPIVLLHQLANVAAGNLPIAPAVAPHNPYLGVMLPYTPLHALLLARLGFPLVATSGNKSEEPICFDEQDALKRLKGVADLFLIHNRPIARPMDDSVLKIVLDRPLLIRGGRGYAPLLVTSKNSLAPSIAVGGHMKNTVAVSIGRQIVISQHVGDLDTVEALNVFQGAAQSLKDLFDVRPILVASDRHPDYQSTHFAQKQQLPHYQIQHHHAHIVSCMVEHNLEGPVLGVAWDGTGYSDDGTLWGGEFLKTDYAKFSRVATLRSFPLPGGEKAIREPRRAALGLLYEIFHEQLFDDSRLLVLLGFSKKDLALMRQILTKKIYSPLTTSAGRLFDVVAALTGVKSIVQFEGQAAMELEYCIDKKGVGAYTIASRHRADGLLELDWEPLIRLMLSDLDRHIPAGKISAYFHNSLVKAIASMAEKFNLEKIVLSGGCFQNTILLERSVRRLRMQGFKVFWPQKVPPNDGGLSLGQLAIAQGRAGGPSPCV